MRLLDLSGPWQMRAAGETEWRDAVVPGSVYADLLRAKAMPDPFDGENERKATEICEQDYEYRRSFNADAAMLSHRHLLLRFDGLDTLCEVFFNGRPVLHAENMHRTFQVDIREWLCPGENHIRVLFHSPLHFMRQAHAKLPLDASADCIHGFSHLRKAHCMSGWDWGPQLPDMGIWRAISIDGWDDARLDDVLLTQTHADGRVTLSLRVRAETDGEPALYTAVRLQDPDGKIQEQKTALPRREGIVTLTVEHPQLWWPNGMGSQPLYQLDVMLLDGGTEVDRRMLRIGLRTLTVDTAADKWGHRFAFVVNGVPFFAMGGDYIPEDSILSRVTPERTALLLKSCAQANYNMVRVWGGGYYPDDFFYDLCDTYGLVVWQDLMYACAAYRFDDDFEQNIAAETADNVRHIRHHACLGLWCGNNEMETAWVNWGWAEKFGPHLRADYTRQFGYVLPKLVKRLDPQTFYWASSPSSGGDFDDPNGESAGDCHYWNVWHGLKPFTDFRRHFPRFMSEFGIQSFPSLKTVSSFAAPEERNIFSPVMEAHQKNSTANAKILHYIGETFRYPRDFDSLLFTSQLVQAEGVRYGVEHWRRSRGHCMGTLYWQINDCWPVASWSGIDYFGRWKALHYFARRFFAPVLLSACEEGGSAALWVTNDRKEAFSGTIRWKLMEDASCPLREGEMDARVQSGTAARLAILDCTAQVKTEENRRNVYLWFALEENGESLSESTLLFVPPKHFSFQNPHLSVSLAEAGDVYRITVRASAYARDIELSLADADAVFSDNFFDLPGGADKTVTVPRKNLPGPRQITKILRVRSLYDTYEHV